MRVLEFQAETTAEQAKDWRARQADRGPARIFWAGLAIVLAIVYLYSKSSPLTLDPEQLYFGTMTVGTESSQRVRVINDSAAAVTIAEIAPLDRQHDFAVENSNCGRSLSPNEECAFTVRFGPKSVGEQNTGVALISESGTTLKQLNVSGGGFGKPIAPTGRLTLNTNHVDFGEHHLGEPASAFVIARNEGQTPLDVSVAIRSESKQFELNDHCAGSRVNAGAVCEFEIIYSPSYEGLAEAQVVVSDDKHAAQTVAVRGAGKAPSSQPPPPPTSFPRADIYPAALAFNAQRARFDHQSREATITNTGEAALRLQAALLNGQGFTKEQDTCSGQTLIPSKNCKITVRFAPEQPGNYSGNVTLATNAPTGAVIIALSGMATAPGQLWVSTRQVDLGDVQLGSARQATQQSFVIANTGGATLQLATPELQSLDPAFSIDASNCPRELSVGTRCQILLRFLPSSPGARTGTVIVRADGDNSPQTVMLSGLGVAAPPIARMLPEALDFGRVNMRQRPSAKQAMIRNIGRSDLSIGGVSIDGESGDFRVSRNDCGARLAAGRTCSVEVTFSPKAEGPRRAILVLDSDSSLDVQGVRLTGVGYQRVIPNTDPKDNENRPGGTPPTAPQTATCWQPVADRIDFELLRRTSDYSGHFRITGVVANRGTGPTGPEAALIQLLSGSTPVAQNTVADLPSGTATVTYETDFSTATEFPPTYSLVVTFGKRTRIPIMRAPRMAAGSCSPTSSRVERAGSEMGQLLQNNNIMRRGLEMKRIPQPVQPQIR